jgi:hypothetical protein
LPETLIKDGDNELKYSWKIGSETSEITLDLAEVMCALDIPLTPQR